MDALTMGFLDRVSAIAQGLGGAVVAPVAFVRDLAMELVPGHSDAELDGVISTMWGLGLRRVGDAAQNLIGPDKGIGAAIGALPGGVRRPAAGVLDGLETAYREGVGEPISTAMTAASLSDRNKGNLGGWGDLFKGDTWREAYRISQHRSPGEAMSLAFGTKDILDRAEVNNYVGTDLHRISSGLWDASFRLLLSPDVALGKAGAAARVKHLVRPIKSPAHVDRYFRGSHWKDVDEYIANLPAEGRSARIRDRLFPEHSSGALIAHYLDSADDGEMRESVMRFFMGDLEQLNTLYGRKAALASRLQRLVEDQALVKSAIDADGTLFAATFDMANAPARSVGINAEIEEVVDNLASVDRMEGAFKVVGQEPRLTVGGAVREAVTRSDLWQTSPLTKPVRKFTDMRPHRIIDLHRPDADSQVDRMLREFGVDRERRDIWRSRIMAVPPEQRFNLILNAEHEAFGALAKQYGLTKAETKQILAAASEGRSAAHRVVSGSMYDGKGRARLRYDDPDGELIEYPLTVTQTANTYPAPDARQVRRALREAGEFKWRRVFGTEPPAPMKPGKTYYFGGAADETNNSRFIVSTSHSDDMAGVREVVISDDANVLGRNTPEYAEIEAAASDKLLAEPDAFSWVRLEDGIVGEAARRGYHVVELPDNRAVIIDEQKILDGSRIEDLGQRPSPPFGDAAAAKALRSVRLPQEAMHTVMRAWKPAVLLRPAWTIRVVLLDEQLRMLAKWGALSNATDFLRGAKNLTAATMKEAFGSGPDGLPNVRRGQRVAGAVGAVGGTLVGGPVGGAVGAAVGYGGAKALGRVSPSVYGSLDVDGFKVQAAFGADADADAVWRALNSADDSVRAILDVDESDLLTRFRGAGEWESVVPGASDYGQAWERAVNDQFLRDPLARQAVEGRTAEQMAEWLRSSPEGIKYRAALPMRRDLDAWAETVRDVVNDYIPESLREKGLAGRLSHADLDGAVPDYAAQPVVHGQTIQQLLGKGAISEAVRSITDKGFHILGTLPTDELSRNRYFRHVYELEMRRKLAGTHPRFIHESTLRKMETSARETALSSVKNLLYDFAERSDFAEAVRYLIPFFPASQEVLTRWTGLAIENPAFIARGANVYGGMYELPEAGVFGISNYTDPENQEWVRFRLPEWAKALVNHGGMSSALDDQGYLRFDPGGLSALSTSLPSGGPFVQLAVSKVVDAVPELEQSVDFMFPYGVPQDWKAAFLPAAGKRLASASGGDEDAARASAKARIVLTRLTKIRTGELPFVDMNDPVARNAFLANVDEEVTSFFRLRAIASWISPTAPVFDSPYQAYIDAYRSRKAADPKGADEWFLKTFGEEYFTLTTSLTRSNNGIPPTIEGAAAGDAFASLIERYPKFGALITGSEGSGFTDKFARSVYDKQLGTPIAPGSSMMQRERLSPEELSTAADTRLAWSKFSRAMDAIEAIRLQRGAPNLRVKGAEDLAEAKRQVILELATIHPAWATDYFTSDAQAWDRKIEALTAISLAQELADRPAIRGLRNYLAIRQHFLGLLAQRESHDIRARSNVDLAFAWDSAVAQLASEPAFGEVHSRWLDTDPVSAPTIPEAA